MKAARALLAWSQEDLARKAGVSLPTVSRLELSDGVVGGNSRTMLAIYAAFGKAGIEFENDDSVGVRLKSKE